MRNEAQRWIELADKVWTYRRDVLAEAQAGELKRLKEALQAHLEAKAEAAVLKKAVDALEALLQKTGGAFYPRSATSENVEFLLVAALVFLGIRTYFVGNFEIPTNSMWPTYNGMTPQVFHSVAEEPGSFLEAARRVALGATPHRIDAPASGEILLPLGGTGTLGYIHCTKVNGRSWVLFPSEQREYTVLVGDQSLTLRVPVDFDLDWAFYRAYFETGGSYSHDRFAAAIRAKLETGQYEDRIVDGEILHCLRTGRIVATGDRVLSFDEIRGDRLLVDRISYHFSRPHVGSGVVFRTGGIPQIAARRGDGYYVKRLVGAPGDTLEVRGSTLFRNGAPIAGSKIFELNASRVAPYSGYEALGLLQPGSTVHVEPRSYFAMGDNSGNSEDSRFWGFVPASEMVGTPLFIYYPFSSHWGLAK